jgi:hypothetical protein
MYSLAAKHLVMLSFKPHLATLVFIAAGSISQAMGQAGGIINAFGSRRIRAMMARAIRL